jgi:hypothetical protein
VRLGGGLLVALAAGAAGAGWWLLAGVVLAALAAGVTAGVPEPGEDLVDRVLVAVARLAEVAVYAIAFGAYVFPAHREAAAAAFVVVVAGAGFAGLKIPAVVVRTTGAVLLVAGLLLVVVCVAVPPVGPADGLRPPDFAGVLVAAVLTLPFLRPAGRDRGGLRVLLLGVLAVLAAFAALHQLGAVRLGLSLTSLRDLLAAADADALQPLLTVVAVVATVVPALAAGTEVRARAGVPGLAGLVVAAAAAYLLPVLPVLVVAGLATVIELLLGVRARRYSGARD